jgi:RND family efflux transporter MFP subunit
MVGRTVPGLVLALWTSGALAAPDTFTVEARQISDWKAVFATVESTSVVPARARLGGTVASLTVDEGDSVAQGQVVALIGDEKLVLRTRSADARIAGLVAQRDQAESELARAEALFERGTIPRAKLDDARTALDVARNALAAEQAQRQVLRQQRSEGQVLAPQAGRVLSVPVSAGSVVMPGEAVAMIAEAQYVLRLRLPERHSRALAVGNEIHLADSVERLGLIVTVYPELSGGRVVADAEVEGLGGYFVGERVLVRIATGRRAAIVVPRAYVVIRYGVDFVQIQSADGSTADVPVQVGRATVLADMPDGIEILSGLRDGDRLVAP